jgi:putative PIN family toxin of toxin-antitoxin system
LNVVIDTNVVISAAINPSGTPASIIDGWRNGIFNWVTSGALLRELDRAFSYQRVLRRVHRNVQIAPFLNEIKAGCTVLDPEERLNVVRDTADNRVLEAAVAGEAEYVVTGDAQLLALVKYEGVQIVTPAHFVAMLATLPPQ